MSRSASDDSSERSDWAMVARLAWLKSGWRPLTAAPLELLPKLPPMVGFVWTREPLAVSDALGRIRARVCSTRYCAESARARADR